MLQALLCPEFHTHNLLDQLWCYLLDAYRVDYMVHTHPSTLLPVYSPVMLSSTLDCPPLKIQESPRSIREMPHAGFSTHRLKRHALSTPGTSYIIRLRCIVPLRAYSSFMDHFPCYITGSAHILLTSLRNFQTSQTLLNK